MDGISSQSLPRLPTLFVPHGGGPCFFMRPGERFSREPWMGMAAYLAGIAASLPVRPKALLVISGHWEAEPVTCYAPREPHLLYDYYGFPDYTYRLAYPAEGAAAVAARVGDLLKAASIANTTDVARGFDHGVFIPMKVAFPDADIPVLQVSLLTGLDPARHLALGRALHPLRDEGVLIIGSGMSYHDVGRIMAGPGPGDADSVIFDRWLVDTVGLEDRDARDAALAGWRSAPSARRCHPDGGAHLLPLMVAVGAAGADIGRKVYGEAVLGKAVSAFRFG